MSVPATAATSAETLADQLFRALPAHRVHLTETGAIEVETFDATRRLSESWRAKVRALRTEAR